MSMRLDWARTFLGPAWENGALTWAGLEKLYAYAGGLGDMQALEILHVVNEWTQWSREKTKQVPDERVVLAQLRYLSREMLIGDKRLDVRVARRLLALWEHREGIDDILEILRHEGVEV